MPHSIHPLPVFLAAHFVEQGEYNAMQVGIHPACGTAPQGVQELVEVYKNATEGTLTLTVASMGQARQALEDGLPEGHEAKSLIEVIEREMTLFRVENKLRERAHILGLSALQPGFIQETLGWEKRFQNILAFFKPFAAQIKGDLVLTQKCLETALGQPVTATLARANKTYLKGPALGHCLLGASPHVGGDFRPNNPCLHIKVGPVPLETLTEYAPGGRQWLFLQNGLLPMLLPNGWDSATLVCVAPEFEAFRMAEPQKPLCFDINTIVH